MDVYEVTLGLFARYDTIRYTLFKKHGKIISVTL